MYDGPWKERLEVQSGRRSDSIEIIYPKSISVKIPAELFLNEDGLILDNQEDDTLKFSAEHVPISSFSMEFLGFQEYAPWFMDIGIE